MRCTSRTLGASSSASSPRCGPAAAAGWRHSAPRRNRQGGWMTLQLRAGSARVALDSSLTGFSEIVAQAVQAARRNQLSLDAVTLANLAALEQGGPAAPRAGVTT